MKTTDRLLQRLNAIGHSLAESRGSLALLGLGSVGQEMSRLDEYSDLDFFAIVEPGQKSRFIDNLDWMARLAPIGYCFRNTQAGYKLMYSDGVFCEFAVFEADELKNIPFTGGRVVWQHPGFDVAPFITAPLPSRAPSGEIDFLVGEAITNLYVGLGRYHRGERLSAMMFIQNYAFQRILDLVDLHWQPEQGLVDIFARERRFEQRFPEMAGELPDLLAGYGHVLQSAERALSFLERNFGVNEVMKTEILALCRPRSMEDSDF